MIGLSRNLYIHKVRIVNFGLSRGRMSGTQKIYKVMVSRDGHEFS